MPQTTDLLVTTRVIAVCNLGHEHETHALLPGPVPHWLIADPRPPSVRSPHGQPCLLPSDIETKARREWARNPLECRRRGYVRVGY